MGGLIFGRLYTSFLVTDDGGRGIEIHGLSFWVDAE